MPPPILPPESVEAEALVRVLRSGKGGAVIVLARGEIGPVECVIKFNPKLPMAPTEHLLEWTGAALAGQLGIRTPRSY
jgi:hypothetical protein